MCLACAGRESHPELFVYIIRPFRFCLDWYAAEFSPFFGDEWNFASERSSIQPRVPFFSGEVS
jgi:hypothetical protein